MLAQKNKKRGEKWEEKKLDVALALEIMVQMKNRIIIQSHKPMTKFFQLSFPSFID
jgi:hypothetical protein